MRHRRGCGRFSDAFVVSPRRPRSLHVPGPASADGGGPGTAEAPSTAVFLTPQSLASFPLASLAVTVLTGFFRNLWPGHDWALASICALFVGTLVFLASVSVPTARPRDAIGWALAIGIALINTVMLAAAALGLVSAARA